LRRQMALCGGARTVTIRHERTVRVRAVPTVRALRRPVRQQPGPAVPASRRAAA
jgi:hypothetical protein